MRIISITLMILALGVFSVAPVLAFDMDKSRAKTTGKTGNRYVEIKHGRVYINGKYEKNATVEDAFGKQFNSRQRKVINEVTIKNTSINGDSIKKKRFTSRGKTGYTVRKTLLKQLNPFRTESKNSIGVKAGNRSRQIDNRVTIENSEVDMGRSVSTGVKVNGNRSVSGKTINNNVKIKDSNIY